MHVSRRAFLASIAGKTGIGAVAIETMDEPVYTYDAASWRRAREGLEFSRIGIYESGKPVDTMAVLRADPERNVFRSYFDRNFRRTADGWKRQTGADAVFNASFYRYTHGRSYGPAAEPAALLISDGNAMGPRNNRSVRGAIVAEPRNGRRPFARLIDMDHDKGYDFYAWNTVVQSWPMLVHSSGAIGASGSSRDSRTAVCEDEDGRILAITTEDNNLTLPRFAHALRDSGLGVKKALNLDGGHAAQMYVDCGGLRYETYGKKRSNLGIPFLDGLMEHVKVPIHGVIAISER